jgi:phosphate starvation-inducible PhoH-like protein
MARKGKKTIRKSQDKAEAMAKSQSTKRVIHVSAMNAGQKETLRTISQKQITLVSGVPGTGKTHLAVGWALQEWVNGRFERIILTRPVVEAGESLGFLPGDAEQKIAPYMMPMMEILTQYLSQEDLRKMIENKTLVILPIAYMRGVTFKNACVIADECQNMTKKQIHLLLTRLGAGSKIILTGDVQQSDLGPRREQYNGLRDAIERLGHMDEIGMVNLGYEWCVREAIVNKIDEAYREEADPVPTADIADDDDDEPASYDKLLRDGGLDDLTDGDWEDCDCEDDDPDCDCEEYED